MSDNRRNIFRCQCPRRYSRDCKLTQEERWAAVLVPDAADDPAAVCPLHSLQPAAKRVGELRWGGCIPHLARVTVQHLITKHFPLSRRRGLKMRLIWRKIDWAGIDIHSEQPGKFIKSELTGKFIKSEQLGKCIKSELTGKFFKSELTEKFIKSEQPGKFIKSEQPGKFIKSELTGKFIKSEQPKKFIISELTGIFIKSELTGKFIKRTERKMHLSWWCNTFLTWKNKTEFAAKSIRAGRKSTGIRQKES